MRCLICVALAGWFGIAGISRPAGADEPPGPAPAVVPAAAIEPVSANGPQIVVQLQVSEGDADEKRVLFRPQIRAQSGQPSAIQAGNWKVKLVAVAEEEKSATVKAAASPAATGGGAEATETAKPVEPTIRMDLTIAERVAGTPGEPGEVWNRYQYRIRVPSGEPASVSMGERELQVTATRVDPGTRDRTSAEELPAELRIYRALQKRISVDFHAAPLGEVLKLIAEKAQVNIAVDSRALEVEGVTAQQKISVTASGLRLCTLLDQILSPLLLDYDVSDEVLKITSRRLARGEPVVVTYDVRDLAGSPGKDSVQDLAEQIAELIAPETWDRNGGSGSIRVFAPKQRLVVRQVRDVQEAIAEWLEKQRAARQSTILVPSIIPASGTSE